ncbi:type 2 lantipeptide synthetase LanM family protein [Streptomyces sp. SCA3-4]|uniref:type 2 lanthipeptide synthetase LanM family protein n=1 Tax=Streptomyces sichuanensis TaxID=2871810 RepID=UPI001CE2E105|nr:type 2 lanthipeptide synthetase LanM family protein [Streptomyces sichuanensis]MCA6092858.1 type 2 lantipeptide synthetase LanM family protein [Streptomyces sichuanensis]
MGMGNAYPLDIAARAANLTERLRVVAAAGGEAAVRDTTVELDAFDRWKTDTLAGKLADKFHQESLHRGRPPQHTKDELAGVLSAYRRLELALDTADDDVRALLGELQSAWLPTYRAALDAHDAARDGERTDAQAGEEPGWRAFDVYYGRLAKACEPFLRELGRGLDAARGTAQGENTALSPQLAEDIQRHLLDRFELSVAWAVEADANVHCTQAGIDKAEATREDYLAYLDTTFSDSAAYHRFYLKFPVLGRWLAHTTALLTAFGRDLFDSLAADAQAIGTEFFGQPITAFTSLRLGDSDPHAGARTVARVSVVLADGRTGEFFYKPRSVRSEAALQDVLARLADDGVVDFATRPVLPRDGYGYEALIPAGRNRVETPEEVTRIYRELGGYLALFYVLGGSDLHFENVIVADGHAFVCDAETVLGVHPQGRAQSEGTLLDSVFKTGLLEWPRAASPGEEAAAEMRISGYAGGEGYDVPVPVARRTGEGLSFAASVVHKTGVHVETSASNRVYLGEELVRPEDHVESIMEGFNRVYDWFAEDPDASVDYLMETFSWVTARFINWGTQIYAQLLSAARHPRCLTEPLEVDLLANTVRTFPRTWDADGVLAGREVAAMWQMDVPLFTAAAHARQLVHGHSDPLPARLDSSPIDHAAARIRRLSERNREQQSQYIAASLSTGEISSPAFVATSLDYAARIGSRLCDELRAPAASAPWTSYQLSGESLAEVDIEADLYQGSAGVVLFLAYLDQLVPRPEYRKAARQALDHVLVHWDRDRLGAFAGLGGVVYLLTHLHRLWGDEELLDLAVRLSDELPARIDEDRHFDILHGAAGLIPVLLGLARETGGHGIEHAHRCAEHLLRHAEDDGTTLSWPPSAADETYGNLTGFSHGSGGIGWALIQLGRHTGRPDYIEAGRKAFAYEDRHVDEQEKDWYDLRINNGSAVKGARHFSNAWCNGAAGIGLARISSWAALDRSDEQLLRDAQQALSATLRNFPRLKNHTLCHGTSGNAELLLRFARLSDEPAFQLEANVQVQALWRSLDEAGGGAGGGSADFFPGLMIGISGFGMHFLRLADPDRVPSVLLLDPPSHHEQ